jgi:hypothetical protein
MCTCPVIVAVAGTGALKLKKLATPGCVTMPAPVLVAVIPDTTVARGVAVARLFPLVAAMYGSRLAMMAVSSSSCRICSSAQVHPQHAGCKDAGNERDIG